MKKRIQQTLKIIGWITLGLLIVLTLVTLLNSPKSLKSEPVVQIDLEGSSYHSKALEHLAQSTTIPVVGYDDANNDSINPMDRELSNCIMAGLPPSRWR